MQKNTLKGSILIWATFLSLIITVTFVSISTNINKNLKNNSNLTKYFKNENQLKNIINSWSINNIFTNQYLDNWDKIIFEPSNRYITTLNNSDKHFWQINVDSNISIKVLTWSAVYYSQATSSWIIQFWLPNTFTNDWTWSFVIENLGWFSKIQITTNVFQNYLSQYRKYTIYKKIWNKEKTKSTWKIKLFD